MIKKINRKKKKPKGKNVLKSTYLSLETPEVDGGGLASL